MAAAASVAPIETAAVAETNEVALVSRQASKLASQLAIRAGAKRRENLAKVHMFMKQSCQIKRERGAELKQT